MKKCPTCVGKGWKLLDSGEGSVIVGDQATVQTPDYVWTLKWEFDGAGAGAGAGEVRST